MENLIIYLAQKFPSKKSQILKKMNLNKKLKKKQKKRKINPLLIRVRILEISLYKH